MHPAARMEHYLTEGPRQSLGNTCRMPVIPANLNGLVVCESRLGGLLKSYRRNAA